MRLVSLAQAAVRKLFLQCLFYKHTCAMRAGLFKIPANLHIGNIGLVPAFNGTVNSVPPMPTGGNMDNRCAYTQTRNMHASWQSIRQAGSWGQLANDAVGVATPGLEHPASIDKFPWGQSYPCCTPHLLFILSVAARQGPPAAAALHAGVWRRAPPCTSPSRWLALCCPWAMLTLPRATPSWMALE